MNEAYPPPASYEDMPEYADLADYAHAPAPAAPQLRFPALSARQRQFGVNPSLAEFRAPDPDFLQYRLEELDTNIPNNNNNNNNNMKLEEELRSILGGAEPGAADKRGMLAAARTAPLIEEAYGETEEAEDFIFTSTTLANSSTLQTQILTPLCRHRGRGGGSLGVRGAGRGLLLPPLRAARQGLRGRGVPAGRAELRCTKTSRTCVSV